MPAVDPRTGIAGLVLAGGNGSRMGGVDKGLQPFRGRPLAAHALARLAPQVAATAVNANRHRATYAAWGAPVWPDADDSRPGPLAGMLAGLRSSPLPWLACVPCDTPHFPADLVPRLAREAARSGAPAAIAWAPDAPAGPHRAQPVFCLLRVDLQDRLAAYLDGGGRRVMDWLAQQGCTAARFDDWRAFRNANTPEALRALEDDPEPPCG
jgi:molybdopterin-guanine dinucleotide biosynthesis protein A